ncbi:MAG: hypothetical protein ACRDTG_08285 [Pseudonocardiaceae bacterium]
MPSSRALSCTSATRRGTQRLPQRDELGSGQPDPGGLHHRQPNKREHAVGYFSDGNISFEVIIGAVNSEVFIDFFRKLLEDLGGKKVS